jgi:hypothetical protein
MRAVCLLIGVVVVAGGVFSTESAQHPQNLSGSAATYDGAIGSKRTNDAPVVVFSPAASFDDGDDSTDAELARLVSLGAVDTALANAPHVWWLTYHAAGLVGVIILEAPSLIQARLAITVRGIDVGATFTEGHELGSELALWCPRRT